MHRSACADHHVGRCRFVFAITIGGRGATTKRRNFRYSRYRPTARRPAPPTPERVSRDRTGAGTVRPTREVKLHFNNNFQAALRVFSETRGELMAKAFGWRKAAARHSS